MSPGVSKCGLACIIAKWQQSNSQDWSENYISYGLGVGVLAFLSKNLEESEEKMHKALQLSMPLQLIMDNFI